MCWTVFLSQSHSESALLVPRNVTLFGESVFTAVMKLTWAPIKNNWYPHKRGKLDTKTDAEQRECHVKMRTEVGDSPPSQGMPKIASSRSKARGMEMIVPHNPQKETNLPRLYNYYQSCNCFSSKAGVCKLFHEEPDWKYSRHCRPHSPCYNYCTFKSMVVVRTEPQNRHKMGVAVFQLNFIYKTRRSCFCFWAVVCRPPT